MTPSPSIGCLIGNGGVKSYTHSEMLDLVVVDGHAKGIIVRNLQTGEITRHSGDAVVLATGGYGNVYNLSTYARGSNVTSSTVGCTATPSTGPRTPLAWPARTRTMASPSCTRGTRFPCRSW